MAIAVAFIAETEAVSGMNILECVAVSIQNAVFTRA